MDHIPSVKRAILADWPPLAGIVLTVSMVALLTLGRWLLDRGDTGMQFAPYFPAILFTALFLGWRNAALAAFLSGVAANRLLRDEPLLFYVGFDDAIMIAIFFGTCALLIYMGERLRRLIRELENAKAREEMLSGELLHRNRNMLAIVGAIAALTARRTSGSDFFPAFADRIDALNRATNMLSDESGELRRIDRLVAHAVAPFRNDGNFALAGPACEIPASSCLPLMLVLHELCTNAAKHGALTSPAGTVAIAWHAVAADGVLRLKWTERGGPPISQAGTPGMGSTLMRAQKGLRTVNLRLPSKGAECDIEIEGARSI